MRTRRLLTVPALPLLVVGALFAQTGLASPAHAAAVRYASPIGSAAQDCFSAATACNIEKAVNSAGTGDEVVIEPGTYSTSTVLSRSVSNLYVHGVAGQPRPVIHTSASIGLQVLGDGARVSDLTIFQDGGQWGLNVFGGKLSVQRVTVSTNAQIACGLGYSGVARDLLCITSAVGGAAYDGSFGGGGTGLVSVRNLTAVATGDGGYGIRADSSGTSTRPSNLLVIDAKNVIAMGTKADVRAGVSGVSSNESQVLLSYSNYDSIEEAGGGNVTNVGSTSTNQTAAPIFADVGFHEAANSPTVDKGTSDGVGTADLDGEPRKNGTAVDIGVDEWWPDTTPPDVAFDHTPKHKTHKHKVTFTFHASEAVSYTCVVDKLKAKPCSSPFKVRSRRYGRHKVTVIAVDASGNTDPTPAVYKWKLKHKGAGHHHKPHHGHHHHH